MNNSYWHEAGGDYISVLAVIAYLFSGRFCEMCIRLTLYPKRDYLIEIQSRVFSFLVYIEGLSRVNVLNRSCHS